MRLAWVEGFKMAQGLCGEEQYLLDIVADLLTRMSELERLREVVRLAEAAAKALPSRELPRQQFESRRSVCRAASTARLANSGVATPDQLSKG